MFSASGLTAPLQTRPGVSTRRAVQRQLVRIRAVSTFPRIIDELPVRRLSARYFHGGFFDLTSKELTRILSPAAGTTPELLTGTSLLFAVISIAVALEFLQRSFQSVGEAPLPGDYPDHGKKSQIQPTQDLRSMRAAHQEKLLRRQIISYEKFRGLRWLAIVTALVVWSTGILNKENPMQP